MSVRQTLYWHHQSLISLSVVGVTKSIRRMFVLPLFKCKNIVSINDKSILEKHIFTSPLQSDFELEAVTDKKINSNRTAVLYVHCAAYMHTVYVLNIQQRQGINSLFRVFAVNFF